MNLRISTIKNNDAQVIERLKAIEMQAFGDAGLDEWNLVPLIRHGRVMALAYDHEVIGGAQFIRDWDDNTRAYLVGIAVDSAYRGKGLGTRFLSACIEQLKTEGVRCIELTVDPQYHGAVRVYEDKLSFRTVETRINEYGIGEDRLVMELHL